MCINVNFCIIEGIVYFDKITSVTITHVLSLEIICEAERINALAGACSVLSDFNAFVMTNICHNSQYLV